MNSASKMSRPWPHACALIFLLVSCCSLSHERKLPGPSSSSYVTRRPISMHAMNTANNAPKSFSKGSGGFGGIRSSSSSQKQSPWSIKAPMGSSISRPEDPQRLTVQAERGQMEASIQAVLKAKPGLQEFMALDDDLASWEAFISRASVLERTAVPSHIAADKEKKKALLAEIAAEHGWTRESARRALHEATWDASAAMRTARHTTQAPSRGIEQHLQATASWCLKAVRTRPQHSTACAPAILDIGCGNGVMLGYLLQAASTGSNGSTTSGNTGGSTGGSAHLPDYMGIDLSSQMILYAQAQYASHAQQFMQADFLAFTPPPPAPPFTAALFSECLHNFADPAAALQRAVSMLIHPGGRVVISHPKGWGNVQMQRAANSWLAPSLLPTAAGLRGIVGEISGKTGVEIAIEVEPDDRAPSYLAVLLVGSG